MSNMRTLLESMNHIIESEQASFGQQMAQQHSHIDSEKDFMDLLDGIVSARFGNQYARGLMNDPDFIPDTMSEYQAAGGHLSDPGYIKNESWEDDEAADRAAFDMQPKTNICPDCEGGRYDPEGECETCGGGGEIFEDGIEEGRDVRKMTNKLLQYMDEGMLDPRVVADAALSYMSESDVADLARQYELIWDDEDEFESVEEAEFTSDPGDVITRSRKRHDFPRQQEITADQLKNISVDGVDSRDHPDYVDAYVDYAEWADGSGELTDEELERIDPAVAQEEAMDNMMSQGDMYRDQQRDSGMMGEDNLGEDPWGLGQ